MASFSSGGLTEQINITATAAGTTTLVGSTSASATLGKQIQVFTGSSTQTVVLPSATTMIVGQKFEIYNESSSVLTIQFQDASAFTDASGVNYNILAPHTSLVVKLQANGTANGQWAVLSTASTGSGTGLNYITYGNAEAGTQGWHTVNWQQTVTVTIASPAVFSVTSTTGMYVGMPIAFTTTGALPTGLTASTTYYISNVVSGSTFRVSATLGGADVNTTGTQSGVHTSYPLVPINDTTVTLSNLAFSTSSSSPLVGSNSYTLVQTNSKPVGGEGAAYDFTIDSAYQAQVLSISAVYNASSTFIASSGLVGSDSDIEFAIWDKTNAVLIPITPKFVTGNGTSNFSFNSSFQAAPNSTSYSLMVFSPTMSANAAGWTFKFDAVQVMPQTSVVQSNTVVAKATFTGGQTLTANTALTFSSSSLDNTASVTLATGRFTAPQSGNYWIGITGVANASGTNSWQVFKNGSLFVTLFDTSGNVGTSGGTLVPLNAGDFVDIRPASTTSTLAGDPPDGFNVFLIGGSTSSGSGPVVTASVTGNYTGGSSSGSTLIFPTVVSDTTASYSTSTGKFTAPQSGYLQIYGWFQSTNSAIMINAYVNGSSVSTVGYVQGNATNISGLVKVNAGDLVNLAPSANLGASSGPNYINFTMVGGGSSASSSSNSVTGSYTDTAGGSISSSVLANYTYGTKIKDSTNSYSGGILTIPTSGEYRFSASMTTAVISPTTSQRVQLAITRNGTVIFLDSVYGTGASSLAYTVKGTVSYPCNANDTISVQFFYSNSGGTVGTGPGFNTFCWERVGN